jgi:hypothetical protein
MGGGRRQPVTPTLAAALGVALALTGCSVAAHESPASTREAIVGALGEAGSAAETARLAVQLLDDGAVTAPVGDTALLDQLEVLDEAERLLTILVPPDPATSRDRHAGLEAVGDVSDAVVAAREWVAAHDDGRGATATAGPAGDLQRDLQAAAAAVDAAASEVGSP